MKARRYLVRGKARTLASQTAVGALGAGLTSLAGPAPVTPKKRRATPEADFQAQAVSLLRLALPPPCAVWWVPNRHMPGLPQKVAQMIAGRFRKMGLLAGVHDLHLIGEEWFATIECKAGRGELTEGQEDFAATMDACRWPWFEARTLGDILDIVDKLSRMYGFTPRRVQLTAGGFIWDRGE